MYSYDSRKKSCSMCEIFSATPFMTVYFDLSMLKAYNILRHDHMDSFLWRIWSFDVFRMNHGSIWSRKFPSEINVLKNAGGKYNVFCFLSLNLIGLLLAFSLNLTFLNLFCHSIPLILSSEPGSSSVFMSCTACLRLFHNLSTIIPKNHQLFLF